jgi:15-cis-phytoene synthase
MSTALTANASVAAPAPPPTSASRAEEDRYLWEAFRHHSRTFSLATRLLHREVRLPVAALYLYCRTVDGLADDRVLEVGPAAALAELDAAREDLTRTLEGRPPSGLLWRRLAEAHERYDLVPDPLFELIDGAEWDLRGLPIETEADLLAYADLVAGSVGAMMLPFLVPEVDRRAALTPLARALGNAMQVTNILRDVGEDLLRLDRVYLPASALAAHGLTRTCLARCASGEAVSPAYSRLMERMMELAEGLYREAEPGVEALPGRARLGIAAAARMYREILNEVRASGYDNLRRRNVVDLGRKLRRAAHDGYGRRKARLLGRPALQVA